MASHPPDDELWIWEPLETRRFILHREMWQAELALAQRADGWYVRLRRYPQAQPQAIQLLRAGPYPDRGQAVVSALGLIARPMAASDTPPAVDYHNGAGPLD